MVWRVRDFPRRPGRSQPARHRTRRTPARVPDQSTFQFTFAPESRTSFVHFGISLRRKAANSAGVPPRGSTPCAERRSRVSRRARTALNSALILSMMGTGVAAGTTMPCQVMASHPRNPVSATVGNSGSEGDRCPEVTAKAAESLA